MPRLYRAVATGMAVMLVVSCTRSGVDKTPASVSDASSPKAAEDIVVTGSKVGGPPAQRRVEGYVADAALAPPPPPSPAAPPPPAMPSLMAAPIVVTSTRVNALVAERYAPPLRPYQEVGRDRFTATQENAFKIAREEPVSTFSIDVDTASYSFVRASLNQNVLPQPAAVRTEEMVNYFPYDYAAPRTAEQPFSTSVAVFPSPWTNGRKLVRIGIRGYAIRKATRPHANLVFLIDTSGSMYAPNKLPLVKQSLGMLLDQLDGDDTVAIVTYAGTAGTALAPTPASQKAKIRAVIDGLGAGGSTAGAEGIRQAYALAEQNLDPHGVNRVILATDGDFNVGITNQDELKGYVERERGKGVFLSVLGFGMGNYNDALMQALAQNGNGAAAYIDTVSEARKTLVDEATSTLFPIAKDVKIQIEFNPATVAEYRLIGYETRMLNREDFDNDKVDAGDVGSGQTVTALYEVVPVGGPRANGDLRYAAPAAEPRVAHGTELGFVKIRYKLPKSDTSRLISTPIDRAGEAARFEDAPEDARFATGVVAFAELLRGGRYSGSMSYDDVLKIASAARGEDAFGYRSEFIQLVRAARSAGSLARLER
ncbi:MAG: VWA domain-containing protein [Pseudomonadota bacterium]